MSTAVKMEYLNRVVKRDQRLLLPTAPAPAPGASWWAFAALTGRLVEISTGERSATLAITAKILAEAQREGELTAWVSGPVSSFFPPDIASHGVDLEQTAVVRVPAPENVPSAGARLAHSGGFGLIVLDLTDGPRINEGMLGRLTRQAQHHGTAVLCLTRKHSQMPSLGSLVSMRVEAQREQIGPDQFLVTVNALKDKRQGAGRVHQEVLHGPLGLH